MNTHGGYREGSGRPAGSLNKATNDQKARLSDIARSHTDDAISTLLNVMENSDSDSARIAAANSILDRGFGKPSKEVHANYSTAPLPSKIELVAYKPCIAEE